MSSTQSTNVWGQCLSQQHEDSRSARNKNHDSYSTLGSRTEEEKRRRRREWQRQQELERQHEKLKQQKILEYERKHAQTLRLEGSTNGTVPLFKDPEDTEIITAELRRIKVDIRRNIPVKGPIPDLQRSIVNAKDVIFKRREVLLKEKKDKRRYSIGKHREYKEKDTEKDPQKYNTNRSHSEERDSRKSHTRRYSIEKHREYKEKDTEKDPQKYNTNRSHSEERNSRKSHTRRYSIEKHREYKEKDTEKDAQKYNTNRSHSEERDSRKSHTRRYSIEKHREYKEKDTEKDPQKYNTNRSHSEERNSRKSHTRRYSIEKHREYKEKDTEKDPHKYNTNRSHSEGRDSRKSHTRERRDIASDYIEPRIHVPTYYNLPPIPIVIHPMIRFRGQVLPMGRGRHSALMAPVRPFPPRFIPPDMYRLGPPPPNPRYGSF